MLPLGLPTGRKRFVSSIRPISLRSPGFSRKQVLDAKLFDIIARTVDGFDSCDIERENVWGFIDVCGFLANYLASSEVLNAMKHSARAPYIHWYTSSRRVKEVKVMLYS